MFQPIKREAKPIRRTSTVVLATSEPSVRYDRIERRFYSEILEMSGFVNTRSRRVPLVDVDRSTVRNILGSVVNLRIDRGRLLGEVSWARCPRSRAAEAKFLDGHLEIIQVEIKPIEMQFDDELRFIKRWSVLVAVIQPAHESYGYSRTIKNSGSL